MTRVTVLMTIYNAGPYLGPAIDSLLAQSFADWCLVAVENGSNDGSKQVLANYRDPRIHVVDLPRNIGRTPALNLALKHVCSDYVAVLDADDLARPNRFARQVAFLDSHPDIALVASAWEDLLPDGTRRSPGPLPQTHDEIVQVFAATNPIAHSSVLYRRDAMDAIGGYPEDFAFAQDFAFYLHLAETHRLAMLPEILVDIREHAQQFTAQPAMSLLRLTEVERLLVQANARRDLSPQARCTGSRALASARIHRGFAHWRAGKPLPAMAAWLAGLLTAPGFCLSRMLGGRA